MVRKATNSLKDSLVMFTKLSEFRRYEDVWMTCFVYPEISKEDPSVMFSTRTQV